MTGVEVASGGMKGSVAVSHSQLSARGNDANNIVVPLPLLVPGFVGVILDSSKK